MKQSKKKPPRRLTRKPPPYNYDIYLAGPLTSMGKLADNLSAFQVEARRLRKLGWTVFSPPEEEVPGWEWEEYMRRDIKHLPECRMLALMPNWEKSRGAKIERDLALAFNMPVIDLPKESPYGWEALKDRAAASQRSSRCVSLPSAGDPDETIEFVPLEETVLNEADRLVTRDRGNLYGPPEEDFVRTAALWSALFRHKLAECEAFGPGDVARAMICLKLSRSVWSAHRDNPVDIAGYAACMHRVEHGTW